MTKKYGYSVADWDKAKEEMRQILTRRAGKRETISYSELVSQIRTIHIKPHAYALAAMLGEISAEEDAAGRGMLSAIVVRKSDSMPGTGFFRFAEGLGHDTSDALKFWVDELAKVHAYWESR